MSKHGPTQEQEVREMACAIAQAIGRYSDEQWAIGPWFMSLTLVARKLADALVAGELDDKLLAIYQHVYDPPPPGAPTEVPGKWVMGTPK